MEAIASHDVIVLCGETGSGKTTQLPQFLLEAGYGDKRHPARGRAGAVVVTQPRRVAVLATARRVAHELGEELGRGRLVGYQVRHERTGCGADTPLRFVTDGILLREVSGDLLLAGVSAVVLDEAHERSVATDVLLGLLARVVPLRRKMAEADARCPPTDGRAPVTPLKLIIMSATLRVDDFAANARLFSPPPPVLRVSARQFPVTVHFARRTEMGDYVGAAYRKVRAIHRRLPAGGILVFLTGQAEVTQLCRRLQKALGAGAAGKRRATPAPRDRDGAAGGAEEEEADGLADEAAADALGLDALDAAREGDDDFDDEEEGDDEELLSEGEEEGGEDAERGGAEEPVFASVAVAPGGMLTEGGEGGQQRAGGHVAGGEAPPADGDLDDAHWGAAAAATAAAAPPAAGSSRGPRPPPASAAPPAGVHVLPLYALLPAAQQAAVFSPPPAGRRLIIVATNVAETSLTLPGIRYVVDAGRAKARLPVSAEAQGCAASLPSIGATKFEVGWISAASAAQRAGRAGRTGPGHAYRLYSSAVFANDFPKFSSPEICSLPLDGVVLQMKAMGIDKVRGGGGSVWRASILSPLEPASACPLALLGGRTCPLPCLPASIGSGC